MKRVQAFGAGVQSVTLLRMILRGEVDPVDRVIFADTQGEPAHVYRVVEREKRLCEKAGIPFDVVTWRNILKHTKNTLPPLFTLAPNGRRGAMLRQCTSRYKVEPIEKRIRDLGWKREGVEQYMGITTDEITRVKPSRKSYIRLSWPLIEKNMTRADCVAYLKRLRVTAAKSACVMCPYRPAEDWAAVRAVRTDWRKAVAYDRAVRHVMNRRADLLCFVHSSCRPLEEAVLQGSVDGFDAECAGYCGV